MDLDIPSLVLVWIILNSDPYRNFRIALGGKPGCQAVKRCDRCMGQALCGLMKLGVTQQHAGVCH